MYSSNSHISLNYMCQSINNVPIDQLNANFTFHSLCLPFYSRILPQYPRTSSGATVNHKLHFNNIISPLSGRLWPESFLRWNHETSSGSDAIQITPYVVNIFKINNYLIFSWFLSEQNLCNQTNAYFREVKRCFRFHKLFNTSLFPSLPANRS